MQTSSQGILKQLWRLIIYIVVSCLVAIALFLSLARTFTPLFDQHLKQFETIASDALGLPVSISSVSATWRDFHPVLLFNNVTLYDSSRTQVILKVQKLYLGISPFESLFKQHLVPGTIIIVGANVVLLEDDSGKITLAGAESILSQSFQRSSDQTLLKLLLKQPRLALRNININWHPREGKLVLLQHINLNLLNSGKYHRMAGSADLIEQFSPQVGFIWELTGDPLSGPKWNSRLYISAKNFALEPWLAALERYGLYFKNGQADFAIWLNWQTGQLNSAQGRAVINNINFFSKTVPEARQVNYLSADMHWRRADSGTWQLSIDPVYLKMDNKNWPHNWFEIIGKDNHVNQLAVGYVPITELNYGLRVSQLMPAKVMEVWQGLQPKGLIQNAVLNVQNGWDSDHLVLAANIDQVSINAWQDWPAINNITGQFIWKPEEGRLKLTGQNTIIEMKKLFRQPLNLISLQGLLHWTRKPGELLIEGEDFHVKDKNLDAKTDFSFYYPENGKQPFLSLISRFTVTDLHQNQISYYFPASIMSTKLMTWLDQAFISAMAGQGMVVFHGPVHDFPFDDNRGRFNVSASVQNVNFNYEPGWPLINNLNADLIFGRSHAS